MYSSHFHVNLVTAALQAAGVQHIVVCPGSRNAPLVHNFFLLSEQGAGEEENGETEGGKAQAPFILHSATDERSAAFIALGITLETGAPAAVCVTSGSALLGTLPAAAEAYYRHLPLLILSADRPAALIGQLDGQTLPQRDALLPYAKSCQIEAVQAPSARAQLGETLRCALSRLRDDEGEPVHLNVAIEEPLFQFTVPAIPAFSLAPREKGEATAANEDVAPLPAVLIEEIRAARLPAVFIGQYDACDELPALLAVLDEGNQLLVLPDLLAGVPLAQRLQVIEGGAVRCAPDVLIHIGGNAVGKRFKQMWRGQRDLRVIRIGHDAVAPDTFQHGAQHVCAVPLSALRQLRRVLPANENVWRERARLDQTASRLRVQIVGFSDLYAMQQILQRACALPTLRLHVGNSTAVRNAAVFLTGAAPRVRCNRGVNGIEGSLSVAVGHALATPALTLAILGDLSFFYDRNALWTDALPATLRIVVMNNGGGQIFRRLPGLEQTPARDRYVAAVHPHTARGEAETFNLRYLCARNERELAEALPALLDQNAARPVLLEVFTRPESNDEGFAQLQRAYLHLTQ